MLIKAHVKMLDKMGCNTSVESEQKNQKCCERIQKNQHKVNNKHSIKKSKLPYVGLNDLVGFQLLF